MGKCWSPSSRIRRAPLLGSSDAADTFLDLLEDVVAVDMSEMVRICLLALQVSPSTNSHARAI